MSTFTASYSRLYQSEQNCQCDNDHDECSANNIFNFDKSPTSSSNGNLKRSRRVRRVFLPKKNKNKSSSLFLKDTHSEQQIDNDTKKHQHHNSFHKGQTLRFHVAKKSPTSIKF